MLWRRVMGYPGPQVPDTLALILAGQIAGRQTPREEHEAWVEGLPESLRRGARDWVGQSVAREWGGLVRRTARLGGYAVALAASPGHRQALRDEMALLRQLGRPGK